MKNILLTIAAGAAIAATSSPQLAFAASFQSDGKLPMYPKAKLDAKMGDMPANAIAQGVPLVLETSDSLHLVDSWYHSNAPTSCSRLSQGGRVQYKCPGGSIVIYAKGVTNIALVPAFGMP